MTARYQGPRWLMPIVNRWDLAWFDRIMAIEFVGPMESNERLRRIGQLNHLQQLGLHHTGLSAEFVQALRRKHPAWNIVHTEPTEPVAVNCDDCDHQKT